MIMNTNYLHGKTYEQKKSQLMNVFKEKIIAFIVY